MTEELYLKDCYLKEFDAKVLSINGKEVILEKTAFYPRAGGLDNDIGKIIWNNEEYNVINVYKDKNKNEIIHVLDKEPKFSVGDVVHGIIDWKRRYRMMRLHTAAHVISAILYKKYNALITGGHITKDYAKDDFSLESENWKDIFVEAVNEANEIIKKAIDVKIYWLPREEAMKIPGIVKLASRLPPEVTELRIVEIPGVDIQADGGPHVKNTKEIGKIEIIKMESKGRKRKRVYYTVKP